MEKKVSKKSLVQSIREKLSLLGVKKDEYIALHDIEGVNWVSLDEVCKRDNIKGSLYKIVRAKLYSKDVTLDELKAIVKELDRLIVIKDMVKNGENNDSETIHIELSDGTEVELNEIWTITDDDSFSEVEVWDCETNRVICTFRGTLPDTEDEDFDMDSYVTEVEEQIYG